MFQQFLRDTKKYDVEYTIRGTVDGKPVLITERGTNLVDVIAKLRAKYPGLAVTKIQVNKEV